MGKSKARDISACMKILHEQYHDHVPEDFDALLKLPGVGRKCANLIMGDVFGEPAIVTDTHCIRLSNRIGRDRNKLNVIMPARWHRDVCIIHRVRKLPSNFLAASKKRCVMAEKIRIELQTSPRWFLICQHAINLCLGGFFAQPDCFS